MGFPQPRDEIGPAESKDRRVHKRIGSSTPSRLFSRDRELHDQRLISFAIGGSVQFPLQYEILFER